MTEKRMTELKMLVSFFNFKAGTHCWANASKTMEIADLAFNAAQDNVGEIKAFLKDRVASGEKDFRKALSDFVVMKQGGGAGVPFKLGPEVPAPDVVEVPFEEVKVEEKPAPVVTPAPALDMSGLANSMSFLGQVVVDVLSRVQMDQVEAAVSEKLRKDVQQFILDNYGPIQRKVEFQFGEKKVPVEGIVHKKFDEVLAYVQADEPVFLVGPAGSGKNVICKQVAKVLGLNFYFSNAVTQEYKITGFTDANGNYQESQFYKAFKDGGVFMLDEMDASIPEVLVVLNAAIANRYFDFPAPIGYVEAHPDFRVVAAGNTFGIGADSDYVGRNQLDGASLDRFGQVEIDYDPAIEESCAEGDLELLNFCRAFRKATSKAGIRTIVSYRCISRMAKLGKALNTKALLETSLIKALDVDDLNAIKGDLSGFGKFSDAFNAIIRERARA